MSTQSEAERLADERKKLKHDPIPLDEAMKWEFIAGFRSGEKSSRVMALVKALNFRKFHDEECADQDEEFDASESCECGASLAQQALAAFNVSPEE